MEAVNKIEFTSELVKEYSYKPEVESIGVKKCTMELWTNDGTLDNGVGDIEWIMDVDTDQEDVAANIGVWWDENNRLYDYNGIFSLPKQAIKLLRKCGIVVPREYERT